MSTRKVRTRFAPSPTGPLHMGGVRTALYNYLFAKQQGGDFLLRIEDTDQTRFVEGAEKYINESLAWCGICVDEGVREGGSYGPYRQSERKEIYVQYAQQLLESGNAYYAFDTPEELNELRQQAEANKEPFVYNAASRSALNNSIRLPEAEVQQKIAAGEPYVIRFKTPVGELLEMQDIVRGTVKVNTDTLDDKVLFKSDGLPTYHLANVVDDHLMEISHVIRGEEWLPSMPLHVLLYRALGWTDTMPAFAHLPLLLKPTGNGKLSKRDGDKLGFPVFPLFWESPEGETASGYREDGYFPEAFVNLLALLGWNPGTEQELFTMDELIAAFKLERVTKSGAKFDPKKAEWFNQQYMAKKSVQEILPLFQETLQEKGYSMEDTAVMQILDIVKERAVFVKDLWAQASFFFEAPREYDAKVVKKRWKEQTPAIMEKVRDVLLSVENFNAADAKEVVSAYIEANELGFGVVMNPLRLCIVGGGSGPDLFQIIEILGKEAVVERINKALQEL